MAYESEADILGYGGAAGGGKTDLLLGLATTAHQRSMIVRERYTDLDEVVVRGDEILFGQASFVWGTKKRWSLPDGRTIKLGAVEKFADLKKFKGRPNDFIGFDEAVDIAEDYVRFIMGWLRTTDEDQRTRVVLTFNPPTTPEGEWIIKFFAPWLDEQHPNPAAPGELRWYIRHNDEDVEVDGPDTIEIDGLPYQPKSRTFIPARVQDNPFLANTDYVSQLNSLPEPLRSQLLFGDFSVGAKDDIWQTIPTAWVLAANERWREMQKPDLNLRAVGVDVSRGGDDNTTIAKLYGTYFDELAVHAGSATPDGATAARHVIDAIGDEKAPIGVDVIGIGASAYDHLKILNDVEVYPINVASAATVRDKSGRYEFANLRSQIYYKFREALDPDSGENIALPPLRELRVDLCAPHYKIVGARIKVESKEDIKKRIRRSTDFADAVVIAWYLATNKTAWDAFVL